MKGNRSAVWERLNRVRGLNAEIDAMLERAEYLRSLAERCTEAFGERVGRTGFGDARYDAVAELADARRALDERIEALLEESAGVEAAIAAVGDGRLRALLEMRYLACMTWEEVADKLGCEVRSAYRLHGDALDRCAIHLREAGISESEKWRH